MFQPISHPKEPGTENIQPLTQHNATEVPISSANQTHRIALPPNSKSKRSSISPVFGSAKKFVENPQASPKRKTSVPMFFFMPYEPFWEDAAMKGISFEPSRKLWELPSKFFHVTMFFLYLRLFEHVSQLISVIRCYQFLDFIYLQMLLVPHVLSIVSLIQPPFSGDSR